MCKDLEDEQEYESQISQREDKEGDIAPQPLDDVRGERRQLKHIHERNEGRRSSGCHELEVLQIS